MARGIYTCGPPHRAIHRVFLQEKVPRLSDPPTLVPGTDVHPVQVQKPLLDATIPSRVNVGATLRFAQRRWGCFARVTGAAGGVCGNFGLQPIFQRLLAGSPHKRPTHSAPVVGRAIVNTSLLDAAIPAGVNTPAMPYLARRRRCVPSRNPWV